MDTLSWLSLPGVISNGVEQNDPRFRWASGMMKELRGILREVRWVAGRAKELRSRKLFRAFRSELSSRERLSLPEKREWFLRVRSRVFSKSLPTDESVTLLSSITV
eukprot:747935-Amorphochlora_amoeboformis.AAC.2